VGVDLDCDVNVDWDAAALTPGACQRGVVHVQVHVAVNEVVNVKGPGQACDQGETGTSLARIAAGVRCRAPLPAAPRTAAGQPERYDVVATFDPRACGHAPVFEPVLERARGLSERRRWQWGASACCSIDRAELRPQEAPAPQRGSAGVGSEGGRSIEVKVAREAQVAGKSQRFGHACPHDTIALHFEAMQPLKAHVHNGRLVLDEPTDLPEGEVIELVPLDEVLANGGDYLDDEERERLHESLRESIQQMKAGDTIDAAVALAELRAHR
jgi:hypothetical protein